MTLNKPESTMLEAADSLASTDPLYSIASRHLLDMKNHEMHIQGYVDGQEKLQKFLIEYHMSTGVSFVTRTSKCRKTIGSNNSFTEKFNKGPSTEYMSGPSEKDLAVLQSNKESVTKKETFSKKFYWKSGNGVLHVPFLGIPFEMGSYHLKQCAHGKQYQHARLRRRENGLKLRRSSTKKLGCNAMLYIKEIVLYPEYEIDTLTSITNKQLSILKANTMATLKSDLSAGHEVYTVKRYYVGVPLNAVHNHVTGNITHSIQPIQQVVKDKIDELVGSGITNTREVKHRLYEFVKNEVTSKNDRRPQKSDRTFYPNCEDIQNHILLASLSQKYQEMERIEEKKQKNTYVILQETDISDPVEEVEKTDDSALEKERCKFTAAVEEIISLSNSVTDPDIIKKLRFIVETGNKELNLSQNQMKRTLEPSEEIEPCQKHSRLELNKCINIQIDGDNNMKGQIWK